MLDPDLCYAAVVRRDPRFDGLFFTTVETTRIYCRPVCPARTPLRRNVGFHATAAQAQAAGFRPCLRCRPESAPDSPAWSGSLATVNRALRLIDEGVLVDGGVERLAGRLGVTSRHLRRLFDRRLGVGPLEVEGARRLHLAKALLHQTRLPVGDLAFAAGYGSLRRFNEAFLAAFGRPPSTLRREAVEPTPDGAGVRLALAYRPPFDWRERLARHVLVPGERIDGEVLRAELEEGGRLILRQGSGRTLELEIADTPVRHLARIVARMKRAFLWDAEAAPEAELDRAGRLAVSPAGTSRPPPGSGPSRSAPAPSRAPTCVAS